MGSTSSSSSSSSDRREIRNLIREADESCRIYSDATREVGMLQLCLETIEVPLSTLERETAIT